MKASYIIQGNLDAIKECRKINRGWYKNFGLLCVEHKRMHILVWAIDNGYPMVYDRWTKKQSRIMSDAGIFVSHRCLVACCSRGRYRNESFYKYSVRSWCLRVCDIEGLCEKHARTIKILLIAHDIPTVVAAIIVQMMCA